MADHAALRGLAIAAMLLAMVSSPALAATPGEEPSASPAMDMAWACGAGSPPIPDLVVEPSGRVDPPASAEPIDWRSGELPTTHDAPELEALLPDQVDGITAGKHSSVRSVEPTADDLLDIGPLLESAGLERSVERMAMAEFLPLGFVSASRIDGIPAELLLAEQVRVLDRVEAYVPCGIWRIGERDIVVFGSGDCIEDDEFMSDLVMAVWVDHDTYFFAGAGCFEGMGRLLHGLR